MCGRYAFSRLDQLLIERLGLDEPPPPLPPRWNLAPGQAVPVLRLEPGSRRRRLLALHWGLQPRPGASANRTGGWINARAETVAIKPAFREAFASRRCLLPADGWYEWRPAPAGGRQPWFLEPADSPVCFAGIWDPPAAPEDPAQGRCAILTCAAGGEAARIHPRMPLILPEAAWERWLASDPLSEGDQADLLAPWNTAGLRCWPVDPALNSVAADHPGLQNPPAQGSLFAE
jgi:putative SOS response-associated peptidase YedK